MGSRTTCTCVTITTIIIGVCLKLDAKLNVIPRDTLVKANDSTFMNCSTSLEATEVQWFHGKNYVYAGRLILEPYNERFSVEINASTGACNLVIRLVQPSDAGTYECADDEGSGDRRSIQLIVLDTDPTCKSNIQSEGFIGPNSCNIQPDVVQLSCSVTYHGNVRPIFQWKEGETNESIADGLFDVTSINNEVTYKIRMNSTLDLNNASFICEAKGTPDRQYRCSSNISKIMYVFSSNVTVNLTMNDEVSCIANSSQSCSYKWKWFSDDDSTTESDNQILKPKKAGWHRCESTCFFGNKSCTVVSMHANVSNNIKSDAAAVTSGQGLLALLVLFVLLVVAVVIFVICIKRAFEKRKNANTTEEDKEHQRLLDELPEKYKAVPRLTKTIRPITPEYAKEGNKQTITPEPAEVVNTRRTIPKPIYGMTILNNELFVVYKWCPEVDVYDSITFRSLRQLNLTEIARPEDIVSCNRRQCLYINGYNKKNKPSKILKLDPNGDVMHRWETGDDWGWDLSVTGESNVILTVHTKHKLNEYSPDGDGPPVREIRLSDIRNPSHAIKLTTGHYMVSHSDAREVLHRVCIVNEYGNLEKSSDGNSRLAVAKMNDPAYFAVDRNGFVMVADKGNSRILLLNSDLEFRRVLIILNEVPELRYPVNILLDESNDRQPNDRLFVADHKPGQDGRILIFTLSEKSKKRKMLPKL